MFKRVVGSEEELRGMYGLPSERAVLKQLARIDDHFRAFIARSPFLLLATSNAAGQCDVSPKGDMPGFVHVLDDHHLAIPDRPGNKRLDGMTNILENPHVGLIFLVPGQEHTLRVNGRAWIVRDDDMLDRFIVNGKRPVTALGVQVEEAYLHCPKAFKRSGIWDTSQWPDAGAVPSMAQTMWDQLPTRPAGIASVEEYHRDQEARALKTLY